MPHRICSEDIECSGLTIPKAVQYLCSQDEKYQAIGAYYIQHTCFQDESAKQQVPGCTPPPPLAWAGPGRHRPAPASTDGWGRFPSAPSHPAQLPGASRVLGIAQDQSLGNLTFCGADVSHRVFTTKLQRRKWGSGRRGAPLSVSPRREGSQGLSPRLFF